ncbi:hypothetical protein QR98_0068880 [Sarcoptes scabiei]|uniref:Uncharacterized protein n=1 Tax=Sarcoptes scabiei TaxID=52283 RepID=A0A132ABL6_SARSC|nr:hypothetical protein QR98_0068880 [Sarcoptes scabiei]
MIEDDEDRNGNPNVGLNDDIVSRKIEDDLCRFYKRDIDAGTTPLLNIIIIIIFIDEIILYSSSINTSNNSEIEYS